MKMTLPSYSRHKVLVIGDLMLDLYWQGHTSRISPEAPVPIVNVNHIEYKAGGASNVALNIAALNGNVDLLGLTGSDPEASTLEQSLQNNHINCLFKKIDGEKTITKLRVLSQHQQLIRLDFEKYFNASHARKLEPIYQEALKSCQAVVISDYGKGTLHAIPRLIKSARAQGVPILIDPKGHDFSIYRQATLITPNQAEFEAVVGPCADDNVLMEKGQALIKTLALTALLVTRSEKGMVLFRQDASPLVIPTYAREVYDVTGAGDTVIGVLAIALAAGQDLETATRLANLAASIVVAKVGTATAGLSELHKAMLDHEPLPRGITALNQLIGLVAKARASQERIVMTNGCFDILHAGHAAYLAKAAKLGDRLIVAINDDNSVKQLKGEDRPINTLKHRMAVISALESVDWVVPFSEPTPKALIEAILPDVLVKGGDYQEDQIAGADVVRANGGDVVILDFVDGCSSSRIIATIKGSNKL